MSSVLILGSKGMLGQELVRVFESGGEYDVTAWDRDDLDVTDEKEMREKVMSLWPDVIINATAYNAVDKCEESEEEYAKAEKLNAEIPGFLADIANDLQAVIVHYSTDYVFNGEKPQYKEQGKRAPGCCGSGCAGCNYNDPDGNFEGYKEYDMPNPLSRYGRTKLEGEKLVAKNCPDNHYIIRLSKLFGKPAAAEGAKKSFFDIMLEKAKSDTNDTNNHSNAANGNKKKKSIQVVDGEKSCFTYAPDLAEKTREIVKKELPSGIYHITNSGAVTWYEAAKKLFEIANIDMEVEPISPDAFPRPAKRAKKSVLLNSKLDTHPPSGHLLPEGEGIKEGDFSSALRPWEEALKEYLQNL